MLCPSYADTRCAAVCSQPYAEEGSNAFALLCQAQVFFTLLSALAIQQNFDSNTSNESIDVLLTILVFVPVALALLLQLQPVRKLFTAEKQAALLSKLPGSSKSKSTKIAQAKV